MNSSPGSSSVSFMGYLPKAIVAFVFAARIGYRSGKRRAVV